MYHSYRTSMSPSEMPNGDNEEGTSSCTEAEESYATLAQRYRQLDALLHECVERDTVDIEQCMERERRFQVEWNQMSRNKLWRNGGRSLDRIQRSMEWGVPLLQNGDRVVRVPVLKMHPKGGARCGPPVASLNRAFDGLGLASATH